ncbi:MAG: DUF3488 domain-containing protein [Myxococcaceae bacterium]|nr:DUF3488 domain-containing protein [Myxococcaceae bacterium]
MSPQGRTRLRLVLRDLSATSAFASIVLSGSVPAWALVAYLLALFTSLAGRRPLSTRPTFSVLLLLLTGLVLFGAAFRGLMDLIVAACVFAGLVTSHRMLSESTRGTDQQVQLTSLLMLAGGAALTGELWYGACLGAFAITSSLSLALGVLEPEGGSEEHFDVKPVMGRVGTGTAFAVAGAVAFFVLFPRLSWNIAARRQPPGLLGGTTGMSDSVRLGGAGDIKSNPRVVARVRLSPDPGVDNLDAYFPGRSFDVFDGREWKGSGVAKRPRQLVSFKRPTRKTVSQNIELLPAYGSRTLIALEHPIGFNNVTAVGSAGSARTPVVEVADEEVRVELPGNGYTYTALSDPDATLDALEDPSRYDALPSELDPRIGQLAAHVLNGEARPLQAALLLQKYLQRDFTYTLELEGSPADPLAEFLFVRKSGHCEHFATALTVLLRSQGFAARVTAGFFGGERIGSAYVLRAGDAHAWTQVFVPGQGWVTVDATPEAGRQNQPARVLAWLTSMYERLEDLWRARVVDYSFQDQLQFAQQLVRPPQSATKSEEVTAPLPGAAPVAAAAVTAVVVYVVVQRLGRKRRAGDYRRNKASGFLDQIEARLSRAGIVRLPGEAIEELTLRLTDGAHPMAPALAKATRAYLGARFGGASLSADEQARLLAALTPPRVG